MISDTALRRVLPRLARQTHSYFGPWYRAVRFDYLLAAPPDAPPGSPVQPLWAGGAWQNGARFTPPNSFDTLYLAEDIFTPLLEIGAAVLGPSGFPYRL